MLLAVTVLTSNASFQPNPTVSKTHGELRFLKRLLVQVHHRAPTPPTSGRQNNFILGGEPPPPPEAAVSPPEGAKRPARGVLGGVAPLLGAERPSYSKWGGDPPAAGGGVKSASPLVILKGWGDPPETPCMQRTSPRATRAKASEGSCTGCATEAQISAVLRASTRTRAAPVRGARRGGRKLVRLQQRRARLSSECLRVGGRRTHGGSSDMMRSHFSSPAAR